MLGLGLGLMAAHSQLAAIGLKAALALRRGNKHHK